MAIKQRPAVPGGIFLNRQRSRIRGVRRYVRARTQANVGGREALYALRGEPSAWMSPFPIFSDDVQCCPICAEPSEPPRAKLAGSACRERAQANGNGNASPPPLPVIRASTMPPIASLGCGQSIPSSCARPLSSLDPTRTHSARRRSFHKLGTMVKCLTMDRWGSTALPMSL